MPSISRSPTNRGCRARALTGTTQNDIVKEYLSRGTYIFPPAQSMRLTKDVVVFCASQLPRWNPTNVCSYHLQEAGATTTQEIAYALATAVALLDLVVASGEIAPAELPNVVGRISFFINAGIRFVGEMCKVRAFAELWDEITLQRYGVTDPRCRQFRYGVQVNSLGLTEQQPENNVYRILLETLAVTLSKRARARAVQLPAWNEALGLPRPFDQQWSLRLQQILAYETDLLEYDDLFDGSPVVAAKVAEIKPEARAELERVLDYGGALAAIDMMKRQLVIANGERIAAIERGDTAVVGVNRWTDGEASPFVGGAAQIETVDPAVGSEQVARLAAWRSARDEAAVALALAALSVAAGNGTNIMETSIACAKAGVTTGEWSACLRSVFGEYRAPTGVAGGGRSNDPGLAVLAAEVDRVSRKLGRRVKLLVGKPGLDGHSNGAEQIAQRARAAGFDVVYEGIRMSPEEIVDLAVTERPHLIGLSVLSGSHIAVVGEVLDRLRQHQLAGVRVVAGGIIPAADAERLKAAGVAGVYTPRHFELNDILKDLLRIAEEAVEGTGN